MINFVDIICKYIKKHSNKYDFSHYNQKYDLKLIIKELLYFLRTGLSWRDYRGDINWHTLYYHHSYFKKYNYFKKIYKLMLNKYFKKNKYGKLKYQLIDSSAIKNQFGVNKIGRNKFYKNKKIMKISLVTDLNGIPISVLLDKGNRYDSTFIEDHLNDLYIVTNSKKYNNCKYKQYFIGDAGYDSKKNKKILESYKYNVIIAPNNRNTKNLNKIRKLTRKQKTIYKKRIKIENTFSWIKKFKRLNNRFDKYAATYESFLFLALIKILYSRI